MKFHLDSNIIEGTPDEILEYTELLRNKGKDNEEESDETGYAFWYLEGYKFNNNSVLKVSVGKGYFEDSKGKRYTYQDVSSFVKPLNKKDTRELFELFNEAKNEEVLLKYYPVRDIFSKY